MLLTLTGTFDDWRTQARGLLAQGTAPDTVQFHDTSLEATDSLFASQSQPDPPPHRSSDIAHRTPPIPKRFIQLATTVAHHRDPRKWHLLYRLAFRLTHGEPRLLSIATDPDTAELLRMDHSVRRDAHKMHAFVRFHEVPFDSLQAPGIPESRTNRPETRFVAFHKPEHRIAQREAGFFIKRFPAFHWSILTPHGCIHWDTKQLHTSPGVDADQAPPEDSTTDQWLAYYAAIFNPARIKLQAMENEMARKYWSTMPETRIIPDLLQTADVRVKRMNDEPQEDRTAAACVPDVGELIPSMALPVLQRAAANCGACDLCDDATQTVFGEGPSDAEIVFVGEQPGDHEDRQGRPFVGPAGQLLDEHLQAAGLPRSAIYVTNAVKHFRFKRMGLSRMHRKPTTQHVRACAPWLRAELRTLQPRLLVCLGGTAARAVIRSDFSITAERGRWIDSPYCAETLATFHPSALLRAEGQRRDEMTAAFAADLRSVAERAWVVPEAVQ
ncbi:MAG: UdgX family uracil-DNA binding protein [Planctomycetota bacterium]